MNSQELLAFRNEMEKIAISETFFLRSAMNTLRKTPSLKVPEQIARATLLAKQKGFEDAAWRLGEIFKEWKKGKHPSRAPSGMLSAGKRLGNQRKSYTAHQAPSSAPSGSAPAGTSKSSWKKKALMYGLPPAAIAAGAYGVHRHNEKQFKKHLGS